MELNKLHAEEAYQKYQKGALFVDLSDACEYRREYIPDAISLPIRVIKAKGLPREVKQASEVVFYCRVGIRTSVASPHLAALFGQSGAHMLEQGLRSWKQAQLPTKIDYSAPIDLMRQVQIAAGSLTLLGAILGWLVSPYFFGLSAFIGAGLVFAGATGSCGMAMMLAKMPWNNK